MIQQVSNPYDETVSPIAFDANIAGYTYQVYSQNHAEIGIHKLKLVGTLVNYPDITSSVNWNLQIDGPDCSGAEIQSDWLPDYFYQPEEDIVVLNLPLMTSSIIACGSVEVEYLVGEVPSNLNTFNY